MYFIVALAILGVRYVILPNIEAYLPDIERLATHVVGAPVRIDSLAADWYRLNPQLRLSGVRLLDAQGQPALTLPSADVLLSWRSLLTLRPALLRLQLRAPVLEARRDATGTTRVAGLRVTPGEGQGRLREHPAVRWLLRQRSIEIRDAEVRWHDEYRGAAPLVLSNVDAVLRYTLFGGTRFALQADPPPALARHVDVRGELRRSPLDLGGVLGMPTGWHGRLYAAADDVEAAGLLPWLQQLSPEPVGLPASMAGRAAARAWVDIDDAGVGSWVGDLALREFVGTFRGPVSQLSLGDATLRLRGDAVRREAHADIDMRAGSVALPGVFEQAEIPFRAVSAALSLAYPEQGVPTWRFERVRADVGEPGTRAVVQADATWQPVGRTRAGTLDLSGRVDRADVAAVGRFAPRALGPGLRDWLRGGLSAGSLHAAEVRLVGDLADFPFEDAADGSQSFRVFGQLREVVLDVAPGVSKKWPAFEDIRGTLLVERASLSATVQQAFVREGLPDPVRLGPVQVAIPRLRHGALLTVEGHATGPARAFLQYVQQTPLSGITGGVLASASATGNWTLPLKVEVPLTNAVAMKVAGAVRFDGNTLRLSPSMPTITRLGGAVGFTEHSIAAEGLRGTLLGGEFTAEGATGRKGGTIEFKGMLHADALRTWWPVQGLGALDGSTRYEGRAAMGSGGGAAFELTSSLQGLALALPEPLGKPAAATWPMSARLSPPDAAGTRHLQLSLPQRVDLALELGAGGRVLRGGLGIGRPAAALPAAGMAADVRSAAIDLDAWGDVLTGFLERRDSGRARAQPASEAPAALPVSVRLQADKAQVMGLELGRARIEASRQTDGRWQAQVASDTTSGRVEGYDPPPGARTPARVNATLERLAIRLPEPGSGRAVPGDDPLHQLPDIELDVEDFRIGSWALGSLRLHGDNIDNGTWRVRELVVDNPAARLDATGAWERVQVGAPAAGRRVKVDMAWKIRDMGGLLTRLDMPDVVAGGAGDLRGTLSWSGQPFSYDLPSLDGHVAIALDKGRFLQAPSTAGRLLGILSLQTLARTATFQRGNLFASGFAWDTIRSDISIERGLAQIASFNMTGQSATAVLSGSANLVERTQNLHAAIVPHIDASAAALLAGLAVNPVLGAGAFLAQWLLSQPLAKALTYHYTVSGSWSDPVVTQVDK